MHAENNINQIKCYAHYKPITFVNMSRVTSLGSRILCDLCQKDQHYVPVDKFANLCREFQTAMNKPLKPSVQKLRDCYTNILQQIQDLIQLLNNKMQSSLFKTTYHNGVVEGLNKLLSHQRMYNLQDFETLAQHISEGVEFDKGGYKLIERDIDDQKMAESNEYLDFSQKVLNNLNSLFLENNLIQPQKDLVDILIQIDEQQQQVKQDVVQIDPRSLKLITNTNHFIADVQLNFDQTIIGARHAETMNYLVFWNQVNSKWKFWVQLQCYQQKLINFQFSKYCNQLITCGVDTVTKVIGQMNKTHSSVKLWQLDKNFYWTEKATLLKSESRLSCLTYSNSENLIAIAQGGTIVILEKQGIEFVHQQNKQKSSEIITTLAFNCYDTYLAAGAGDQQVTIWAVDSQKRKLTLFQQLKLYNTPKIVLFSNQGNELFVCTKDGLLHIFNRFDENFQEIQKIVNNINKIRTIGLSKDSKILGVGGETNTIQLWHKDAKEWRCFEEIKQDDFIESMTFGNYESMIVATSNSNLNIHYKYY